MPNIGRPAMKLTVPSDRMDHPAAPRCSGLLAIFFTDNRIGRAFGIKDHAVRGFGGAVGLGDRGGISLGLMVEMCTEEGPDDTPCHIGESPRQFDLPRPDHPIFCALLFAKAQRALQIRALAIAPDQSNNDDTLLSSAMRLIASPAAARSAAGGFFAVRVRRPMR